MGHGVVFICYRGAFIMLSHTMPLISDSKDMLVMLPAPSDDDTYTEGGLQGYNGMLIVAIKAVGCTVIYITDPPDI